MDQLGPHLNKIKVPGPHDKVYKDECVYSFDSPVNLQPLLHLPVLLSRYF